MTRALLMSAALALCACSPPKAATPAAPPLAEPPIVWNLASVNGAPTTQGSLESVKNGEWSLRVHGPCKTMHGPFAQQGPEVLFAIGGFTDEQCSAAAAAADDALFTAILAARRMETDGELMILLDANGKEVVTFTRPPALSSPPSPP